MFVWCTKKVGKHKVARKVHVSVCMARSAGECVLDEMKIADGHGVALIDECIGCTQWIDQVEAIDAINDLDPLDLDVGVDVIKDEDALPLIEI